MNTDTAEQRVVVVGGGELSVEHRRQLTEALAARGGDEVVVVFCDNFRDIPQALARIPEVATREAEAAVRSIQRTVDSLAKPSRGGGMAASSHFVINHTLPPLPDPFAPVNNRAARRARQLGRTLR